MRSLLRIVCIVVLALSATNRAPAQSASTAELHVLVKDPKGAVVKNANVAARSDARNIQRTVSANVDGEYTFLLLPPGQYAVTVEAPEFARATAQNVIVTVGQRAELPVTLQVATRTETVNVDSEAELIQTQTTSATTTVDQVRIDNLPINGRNYINFALTDSKIARDTAPSIGAAPTSGLNFSGQRARSNLVNVDGADAVDNSTNGIRSTVSQEAVQEFQIITNGYSAEYGRASGGVVNIISRSGTNAFHGTAFGYLRNRHIQGVNPFSTIQDPAYTRVQSGVTLGGPLRRDKTFYFFSYEGTRRRETGFSTIGANNFDLVPFDTTSVQAITGVPLGTVLLTQSQVGFINQVTTTVNGLPAAVRPAVIAALGPQLTAYLAFAGGSSGMALNRAMPSPFMPAVIAQALGLPAPAPGTVSLFPSSLVAPPGSYVGLNSLRGNFPVSESTDLYSLRLDHRFSNSQSATVRVGLSPSNVTGIQVNAQGPQNFGQNAWSRTSEQNYHDSNVTAQHMWLIGSNKVNEFRFQYAYRGLLYNFSHAPGGSNVAVNIPGFAFLGREPYSYVNRTEQRYQFTDNFTLNRGTHTFKWGGDVNVLPLDADFTVNFGGVYNMGALSAAQIGFPSSITIGTTTFSVPGLNAVQAYGFGVPQAFIQGVGNPHDTFTQKALAGFLQDTWRLKSNLTLNYGVRYDVELSQEFRAINAMSQAAQDALGITQGFPRDYNNIAPRIGLAWDPANDGKTVLRASYGMFYDHPLLAIAFDSDVADGAQAPQIVLFGGKPGCGQPAFLNAANTFQGILGACVPAAFNFLPSEQRFNPAPNAPSIFVGQQYLQAGVPLLLQPFGFPVAKNFQYAYSNQANLTLERELGNDLAVGLEYNFNGGRHLYRPINKNASRPDLLTLNFQRATVAVNQALQVGAITPAQAAALRPSDPLSVAICPALLGGIAPAGNYVPAALVSFFRPSGINPSLTLPASPFAPCTGNANTALQEFGLGLGVPVPFSDMPANYSDGSSVYHGFTANLRKRFSHKYEFLASYTWSHAIDDGTDLESPLEPQDNFHPERDRANSFFDQRHRFVFSGVLSTGKLFGSGFSRLFNDWTFAPILEVSSGRPFNIITASDRNFDLSVLTDRPMVVPSGTGPTLCGDPAVLSRFSPTGFFQLPCFLNGTFTGNLGRNAGVKPWTVFNDMRVAKRISITERVKLDGIMDVFNVANRFNTADVNPLYSDAGRTTAAFDPRQFQFALKLSW